MENFRSIVIKSSNFLFGKFIQKSRLPTLFSKINPPKDASFLEIGCNDGYVLKIISEFLSPKVLIGVDIDKKRIKKAKKRIIENKLKNVKLKVADAQNLPFKNKIFDGVFMFATLHHIENWEKALFEVSRVLKKGGYFIFKEPLARFYQIPFSKYFDQPMSLFNESELKKVLRLNKFKINHWSYRGWYKFLFPTFSIEAICQKI